MEQSAITRTIMVAAGRFAPGHLGELTQQVPFEMVDAVLADTHTVQRRIRNLPARVVVYLLLAGCLFAECGYRQVWHRLAAGLDGLDIPAVTEAALSQARRRLGPAPLRALFDLLRGPAATTESLRWRGLLLCAIDGTIMSVPDSPANLTVFTQATRWPVWRWQLPDGAAADRSGLRHPHDHRRSLRPRHHRRDRLRPTAGRQHAHRHADPGRPQLRRRSPAGRHRRDRRGPAGARPDRQDGPSPARAAPPPRRLLPFGVRRQDRPRHRRRDHDHYQRRRPDLPVTG